MSELDELQRHALEADGAQPGAAGSAPGEKPDSLSVPLDQEISGLVQVIAKMLTPIFPSLPRVYTDQNCAAIGVSVAAVCKKRGWLPNGIGGEYAAEVQAAFILVPIAISTALAVRADMQAAQRTPAASIPTPAAQSPRDENPDATAVLTVIKP